MSSNTSTAIELQDDPALIPGGIVTPVTSRAASGSGAGNMALPFRARRWVPWTLLLVDVLVLKLAAVLGWAVYHLVSPWQVLQTGEYLPAMLALASLPIGCAIVGLYGCSGMSPVERLRRRCLLHLFACTVMVTWVLLVSADISASVLLLVSAAAALFCPIADEVARMTLARLGVLGVPVAVLGAGRTGRLLIQNLQQHPTLGLVPVAVFDDDPQKRGCRIEGVPVLGPINRSRRLAGQVQLALVAMPGAGCDRLKELSQRLPFPRVLMVPDLIGVSSMGVRGRDLGGVLGLELQKPLQLRRHWWVKRAMDLALGLPLLIVALPMIGLFGLLIRLVSPGPALYRQHRVGLGGRRIEVLKLRTMHVDAEQRLEQYLTQNPQARAEWNRYFKLRDDPRILPVVGNLLRRTSLDELPQLWNVVAGHMSLVGPRPFPLYHLCSFSPRFRTLRRSVRPGLTGMWQVSARSDGDVDVQEAMDTYYIRNWSIWLDLHLLARTVWVVLVGRGSR